MGAPGFSDSLCAGVLISVSCNRRRALLSFAPAPCLLSHGRGIETDLAARAPPRPRSPPPVAGGRHARHGAASVGTAQCGAHGTGPGRCLAS